MCGKMCQSASSLGEALRLAGSAVSRGDLVLITGSFYLIGQAKKRFGQEVLSPETDRKTRGKVVRYFLQKGFEPDEVYGLFGQDD